MRFGVAKAAILPDSKDTQALVESTIREMEVEIAQTESILGAPTPPTYTDPLDTTLDSEEDKAAAVKLSKLLDDDFPFDESQLEAINGIVNQRYACLTGAAGTGKTTSTKAIVDRIQNQIGLVDMKNYFKRVEAGTSAYDDAMDEKRAMEEDDYEMPESAIPSICLVGFTGRSSQMIKKNFPRDWHGNIMTIHRMLAFAPEYYDAFDAELGYMRSKMRFAPTYTEHFKLPWDVIVIDEAGMVSVDLWLQVWAAAKEGCRIIMIGDINQLPPVHGRSIFGYAMTKWPSWELTHIHRQEGVNNSIVDNAWRVLKGQKPISDDYKNDPTWKFAMMEVPDDSALASRKIRAFLERMAGTAYVPNRDSVITATNGEDSSARGYALGQVPMNRALAIALNKDNPRFIIDAGRERKQFAVGDKVMATKNDHEAGITNGMTGNILSIEANGQYAGDYRRFGRVDEVNKYLEEDGEDDEDTDFSLDELAESLDAQETGRSNTKEAKDRGPASHIVTVRFGDGEHGFEISFATLAEVASLMTAYVVTCHKMQGGESPLVIIICHSAHKSMLNREWLYTAITRASKKCVLFYTDLGVRAAIGKQRIKGNTLSEKVKVFVELNEGAKMGLTKDVQLADPESLRTDVSVAAPRTMVEQTPKAEESNAERTARLAELLKRSKPRVESKPTIIVAKGVHLHNHVHVHQAAPTSPVPTQAERRASALKAALGDITRKVPPAPSPAILPTRKLYPQWGAHRMQLILAVAQEQSKRLLPCPTEQGVGFPEDYINEVIHATIESVSANVAATARPSESKAKAAVVGGRFRFGGK